MDAIKMNLVTDWLRRGFDLFKANAAALVVATLLTLALNAVTLGILAGPLLAGLAMMALALADQRGPRPEAGDVFRGFQHFLQSFLFCLVWGLLLGAALAVLSLVVCIGPLLCAAAALVAKTLLMFALFLIVDRKIDFWPASLASMRRVQEQFPTFLVLAMICGAILAAGAMLCVVGLLAAVPLVVCCLAVAYRDVFGPAAA